VTSKAGDRILASRWQFGQGMDPTKVCFDLASNFSAGAKCIGRYVGLMNIDLGDGASEFLHLEYADKATLYVPVDGSDSARP